MALWGVLDSFVSSGAYSCSWEPVWITLFDRQPSQTHLRPLPPSQELRLPSDNATVKVILPKIHTDPVLNPLLFFAQISRLASVPHIRVSGRTCWDKRGKWPFLSNGVRHLRDVWIGHFFQWLIFFAWQYFRVCSCKWRIFWQICRHLWEIRRTCGGDDPSLVQILVFTAKQKLSICAWIIRTHVILGFVNWFFTSSLNISSFFIAAFLCFVLDGTSFSHFLVSSVRENCNEQGRSRKKVSVWKGLGLVFVGFGCCLGGGGLPMLMLFFQYVVRWDTLSWITPFSAFYVTFVFEKLIRRR